MSVLVVTGTAEVNGQVITGTATAEVTVPRATETIDVKVDARRLIVFAELVEHHAAAIRRDLERFMAEPDGFEWFRRESDEGERM